MFYLFLAEGFEETEALACLDVMRRAKLRVQTAGVTGEFVISSHGVCVKSDVSADDIDYGEIEGVILPGGMPGTLNLEAHSGLMNLLDKHYNAGKEIAAICAAPSILAHKGYLKGKKATCYPGFDKDLVEGGATHTGSLVEECGNIVTAKGPGAALELGYTLVARHVSPERAAEMKAQMIFEY
jgi:4-methyl-5(b-hydroxyethyl)-thiazole monophosphate biosynthesis